MGSFAEGNAVPNDSDLDLRVIISGYATDEDLRSIEQDLMSDDRFSITPDACTELDIRITQFIPDETEPNVLIWNRVGKVRPRALTK